MRVKCKGMAKGIGSPKPCTLEQQPNTREQQEQQQNKMKQGNKEN